MTTAAPDAPTQAIPYGYAWDERLCELGRDTFRPIARVSLREWSESERSWPDGTPYRTDETPHVREVMDAYNDPSIEEITIVKPTQSGLTEGFAVNAVGFHIDQDPRAVLLVIPSVDEARKWSHKKLQPMIDNTPVVQGKLEDSSRSSANTMVEKTYAGGSLGIVGSNSGRGFRMVTIGTAIGDDVEGWDQTAGKGANSEGGQVGLIRRRTDRVPDRKLVWISTPRLKGGRIHQLYEEMERRGEWHVPCPHCDEVQVLRWGGPDTPYGIKWEQETVGDGYKPAPGEILRGSTVHRPNTAYYLCEANGCVIEEDAKPGMEAAGDFLTEDGEPVRVEGVRSIGLWLRGALAMNLPGAEWARYVREFLGAKDDPEDLKTFYNLVLGEFWESRGESLEWERLYERREDWPIGQPPEGVQFLTVGADVQATWCEAHVWGWGWGKESWFVDRIVIDGPITRQSTRDKLTEVLHSAYATEDGRTLPIAGFAIDTGHDQQAVLDWARETGDPRVMCVKGASSGGWSFVLNTPKKAEVTYRGKRSPTSSLIWGVGVALLKQEFYGLLRLPVPLDGEEYPPGYVHLPMVDDELCKQLVAEDLVTKPSGQMAWEPNRARNEGLDCRNYARAAAERHGLGRMVGERPEPKQKPKPKPAASSERGGSWLDRNRPSRPGRKGKWLDR